MGLAFVHCEAAEPIRLPYIDKWAPNSGQEHFAKDDLVAWAWNPGLGREPAPGSQELAGKLVQAWIDSGAQCP